MPGGGGRVPSDEEAPAAAAAAASATVVVTTAPSKGGSAGGGGRRRAGGSSSSSSSAATAAAPAPARAAAPPPPPPPPPGPGAAAAAAASAALAAADLPSFEAALTQLGTIEDPAAVATVVAALKAAGAGPPPPVPAGRGEWVWFAWPPRPAAGGALHLYYNAAAPAAALRGAPTTALAILARVNGWSAPLGRVPAGAEGPGACAGAPGADPAPGTLLPAAPAALAPGATGAWVVATLPIPADAYELNWVAVESAAGRAGPGGVGHEGIGRADNNAGADFCLPSLGSSWDRVRWEEAGLEARVAADAAAAAARAKAAAAAAAAAEAAAAAREVEEAAASAPGLVAAAQALAADRGATTEAWVPDEGGGGGAAPSRHLLWTVGGGVGPAAGGGAVTLFYNAGAGGAGRLGPTPLPAPPSLHWGHGAWEGGATVVAMRRVSGPPAPAGRGKAAAAAAHKGPGPGPTPTPTPTPTGGDWWAAEVSAALTDGALPFAVVAADGVTSDNAGGRDHWVAVSPPAGCGEAGWVARVAQERAAGAAAARAGAAAAAAAAAAARASRHAAATAAARALRRSQARHVLYTAPEQAAAGAGLALCYRPDETLLGPAPPGGVWLTAGFNGWAHPRTVGPVAMAPPSASSPSPTHWTATLDVPPTAWCVDAVFAGGPPGSAGGQAVDNSGGFDYSLPVAGSSLAPPPLHIVHVAVEMAPIAKVGGLADVVTALGRASAADGHTVEVVLPRYAFFSHSPLLGGMALDFEFDHGGTHVWVSTCTVEGLPVRFLEPASGLFSNDGSVYSSPAADQGRFDWFCGAAAAYLACRPGRAPAIVHAHDWSTAPIARILANGWQGGGGHGGHGGGGGRGQPAPACVFTIHNAEFGVPALGDAAHWAARVTTVSPSYAADLRASPAFAPHAGKLVGILNGIDPDIWDPASDAALPLRYTPSTSEAGKAAARAALRARLGLTGWEDKPVCVVISRLTAQKGIALIEAAAGTVLARGGQFVLLGSAPDPRVAAHFAGLAARLAGENAAFYFGFDEPLSRLMYGAADFVLVPSLFEPCGLTQLVGMRYGGVPVVRATGGLADSVFDCDYGQGRAAWEVAGSADPARDGPGCTNGFAFDGTDAGALDSALHRALDAFYGAAGDRAGFRALQARVMRQDWSW